MKDEIVITSFDNSIIEYFNTNITILEIYILNDSELENL